jgi:hypothetical protein
MFDALEYFNAGTRTCDKCGRRTELILYFDFGKRVGRTKCKVLDVFRPARRTKWDGVTFHPFLVVLRRGRTLAYWLPYWHTERGKKYYGQWAAFLGEPMFRSLLLQAKNKGYLQTS